jgi:hypothetical protein
MAEEKEYDNPGLISIGQPPGIPVAFDSDAGYNNYIKKVMRLVDIIPLYFTINPVDMFKDMTTPENNGKLYTDLVKLDYKTGIYEFNRKLAGIGHPKAGALAGARLWITAESTLSESVTNSYKPNALAAAANKGMEQIMGSSPMELAKAASGGKLAPPGATGLLAGLLDSKQVSLPQIWESTDYAPSVSFTVKLSTPYGDEQSYINNIVTPLIALLSLISPSSSDGVTYGLPPFFTVKAYGSMHMTLGIIENFTIERGGADTRFNAKKQPLEININMAFKQAIPGFGAMIGTGTDPSDTTDVAKFDDVILPFGTKGTELKDSMPGIVTLGSIIESLRPADPSAIAGAGLSGVDAIGDFFEGMNIDGFDAIGSMIGDVGGMLDDAFSGLGDLIGNIGI